MAPSLGEIPAQANPAAALGVVPYPNQAFWSFSAVWSGWIWGKEAASALHGVLARQRFDSRWVGAVLTASFSRLPKGIPFHAEIPEVNPGYAHCCTGGRTGRRVEIEGIACEQELRISPGHLGERAIQSSSHARIGGLGPTGYDDRCAFGTRGTCHLPATGRRRDGEMQFEWICYPAGNPRNYEVISYRLQQAQKENFEDAAWFKVYGSRAADSQGLWWLQKLESSPISLADRLERVCPGRTS